ncbi:hypothetical protein K6U50_11300 [Vibrio fluvialis]|nr:hypothetical protein [Vibrio alginolyticus]MCG6400634.1 hypothetical protein [Vibrio fluvialis]
MVKVLCGNIGVPYLTP